jgi:hypothetical protein
MVINFFWRALLCPWFSHTGFIIFLVEHDFTPGLSTILSRQNTRQVKGNNPSLAP